VLAMADELKRGIGTTLAVFYGVGVMLGAGIYVIIGETAALAGNTLWLAFLIAAVVALFTGLAYAELASAFPRSASEYFYTKRAFGNTWAFLSGWIVIITNIVATATVALGFGSYFTAITGVSPVIAALALVVVTSFIAFWGIRESAVFNVVFTLVEVAGLVIVIAVAVAIGSIGSVDYLELPHETGIVGVLAGAALIFFAFIGFEEIVNLADQTKKPAVVIPRALMVSLAITTVLYVLVGIASVSIVPYAELEGVHGPLTHAVAGFIPAELFSIIPLFATANTVLIIIIVNGLVMYGMARDNALPNVIGRAHKKRRTPYVGIIVTCLLVLAFVLPGDLGLVAIITDIGVLVLYGIVNLTHIQLRRREPDLPRPFRSPVQIGKHSLVPFIGFVTCAGMVLLFDPILTGLFFVIVLVGYVYYRAYLRFVIKPGRWKPSGTADRVHIRKVIDEERDE